mgnify:CR=1 FL=1
MRWVRAWAKGIVSWLPPGSVATEFRAVWCVILLILAVTIPSAVKWAPWAQATAGVLFVVSAGFLNYFIIYIWGEG